jgi:hypothetical protein
VPSQGADAEMVIWQPSSDTEWEFWVTSQTYGTWSACWGGMIQDVLQNPGIFAGGLGVTASGLPLLEGLIRIADLRSGAITTKSISSSRSPGRAPSPGPLCGGRTKQ